MNRRGFLRSLLGAAVVAAKPTYFFAPIGGWSSPTIINPYEPMGMAFLEGQLEYQDSVLSLSLLSRTYSFSDVNGIIRETDADFRARFLNRWAPQ